MWEGRAEGLSGLMPDIEAGAIAYAHHQAHWRRGLMKSFSDKWAQPTVEAAREAALENIGTLLD
jgi:hypothetical protein